VQPQGEVGDLPRGPGGRVPGAGSALTQLRSHYLLDQGGFPVGRGPDRPQVPGLHAVLAQCGHHPGYRERVRAVLSAHPPDQAVVFELGQLRVADFRRLEQLAPGHVSRCPPRPAPAFSDRDLQPSLAAQAPWAP
jgi:hypothetical protein